MGTLTAHRFGLSIALGLLFLVFWMGQFGAGWVEYQNEQESHGNVATFDGYVPMFLHATLENWQSEYLQLASMVVLTSFLIHAGSPQSKDGADRLERKVDLLLAYNGLDTVIDPEGYVRQGAPLDEETVRKFSEWQA